MHAGEVNIAGGSGREGVYFGMWGKIFDLDNPVMRFLSRVGDMLILNLLFIVCSLPVFTVGAALSALNYVCLKMKDGEEGYIWKSFFRSFKENFKQGTGMGLIMLALGLVLAAEYRMLGQMEGGQASAMRALIFMAAVLWYMILVWAFALQSRFYNPVRATFRNAILLTFGKAPRSIAMTLILAAELLLAVKASTVVFSYLILWVVMFGFSVQTLINTQFTYPVIRSMKPPEEEEEETPASGFTVDEEADVSSLGYTPLPKKGGDGAEDAQGGEDPGTEN